MKFNLILIGYWKSHLDDGRLTWPHPVTFVDEQWDVKEKEIVLRHLKRAPFMPYASGGFSFCRFDCGLKNNGSLERSDGVFLWPEGLAHYIEVHNVKPPFEFIEHCKKELPFVKVNINDKYIVSNDWWLDQKGHNPSALKSFTDPFRDVYSPYIDVTFTKEAISQSIESLRNFIKKAAPILNLEIVELYKKSKIENQSLMRIKIEKYQELKKLDNFDTYMTKEK